MSTPAFYLVTYAPLACSLAGRRAMDDYGLPPFVDGSIRREPDLEHEYPSISCLCRAGKFAPRLAAGDFVAYMTRKARYDSNVANRRLTAILRVHHVFASHTLAASWYRQCRLNPPHNCVVPDNPPLSLDYSHRRFSASRCAGDGQTHREWDTEYRSRAKNYPTFVVCQPLFRDLSASAPVISDQDLLAAFGKIPGTQNPRAMTLDDLCKFVRALNLPVPPFFR